MEKLSTENISGFKKFLQISIDTLNIFAPCKEKYSRGNNMPFMNKSLKKAHMKRSRLRNICVKNKTDTNRIAYIKQRNYCLSLLRKTKKDHYANLNEKDVAVYKQFWRTAKPLLLDKVKLSEKITLVEGEDIINEDGENAKILNTIFSNGFKKLKIPEYQETDSLANNIFHPIFKTILKYRNDVNIVTIKNLNKGSRFDFCRVRLQDVVKEMKKLSTRKATQYTDFPAKVLKTQIFLEIISVIFSMSVLTKKISRQF